jgi:hypothetical protein
MVMEFNSLKPFHNMDKVFIPPPLPAYALKNAPNMPSYAPQGKKG